ncbi:MAG: hypothetical protein LC647_01310, partial [Beggiatoa sp.]|nr:hypothetical protein [Beggiatoa sp.]
LEARVREREQGIDSLAARKEQELERARILCEEAERQTRIECERLEQEAREVEARMKEAERKIAEYRSAFERMHAEKKAKLRAEKARIEAEAERIQGVLKRSATAQARGRGPPNRRREEVTRLKRTENTAYKGREIIDGQIKLWEQRVVRAQARENAAARAQDIALGVSETTAADLARSRETEARLPRSKPRSRNGGASRRPSTIRPIGWS